MFRIYPKRRMAHRSEEGYILIAIIFAVTLAVIALALAVPAIKAQIQRDREDELIHRGHQYTRAIQLYYRKFGRYPNSVDDLLSTNTLRFLRKKYSDPITGKDEWRMIHFGQAQPKPIPAYLNRGGGPGGIGGTQGGTPASALSGAVSNAPGAGSGATNASDISSRLSGATIGGGPIVGLASTSDKQGLKEIDGKTKYSDWEFVYDPTLDPARRGGGTPQNNLPNNINPGPRPTRPTR